LSKTAAAGVRKNSRYTLFLFFPMGYEPILLKTTENSGELGTFYFWYLDEPTRLTFLTKKYVEVENRIKLKDTYHC